MIPPMKKKDKTPLSTLYGGEEIPITFADDSTGDTFVRAVAFADLGRVYEGILQWQPRLLLLLYTGEEEAWVDSLSDESAAAILQKGHELNFPRVERWMQMERQALETIAPLLQRQAKAIKDRLPKSPRTSPSPPAGPASKSSPSQSPG